MTAPTGASTGYRVRRLRRSALWTALPSAGVVALLAYVPYVLERKVTDTLVDFFILLVLATTWNMLAGFAGLVSVGQQAYIGVGAYAVLVLAQQGVNPFAAIPLAALVCAAVSLPVSWLVFRLRGGYFAIGTWVVAEVFALLVIRFESLGGGTGANLPGLDGFDAVLLGAMTYWAALSVAVLTLLGAYLLLRSRTGLALTAVRDNELAARSVGVRVPRAKRMVYLAAAAGAGAAGAVLVITQLNVQPGNVFSVKWSAYMVFVVLIGGVGSLEGPILGAIVFFVLQRALADYGAWYLIVLGAVAVVMAVWVRRGLWGLLERFDVRVFPTGFWLQAPGGDVARPPRDDPPPAPRH
ncbi:MAG: branched-chain amino acid transporter permease [Frankiales bacterium]|jgi:branched-chain amino acid transport system permease protein|nr:branched-chain amino acid transporter permease [Frankiales bacterium]